MKLTITSIELKSPFKFFALSASALKIVKQLKSSRAVAYKSTGFWTKHYTMSLWETEENLKTFVTGGAHLQAMKNSSKLAREIRTLTMDANSFPNWKTAKKLLEKGKIIRF